MSSKLRNPFRLRASDKIESDVNFLRLYSPDALEMLIKKNEKDELWGTILFIRSSPGAGKTSLLRIFEPNALSIIHSYKSQSKYRELFKKLNVIGAIDKTGVQVLGVSIKCTRNYGILEDLGIREGQKKRFFFSLLNARITMATLRSILKLKKLNFPDDLKLVSFNYPNEDLLLRTIQTPCNGQELFDWASNIERRVYEILDSFLPIIEPKIEGHDELFSVSMLRPEYFHVNEKPVCSRILFTIDDAHKLTEEQYTSMRNYLAERRGNFSIWISERLENLKLDDYNSQRGRDYQELNLEEFWGKNSGRFEKVLGKIADKRTDISKENVNSFQENLEEEIDEDRYKQKFELAIQESKNKLELVKKYTNRFDIWIENTLEDTEVSREKAIYFRKIQILIARNRKKAQMAFEFPLTIEELNQKMDISLENAAILFLSKEYKLPYYFGFKKLAKISSNNIEQFLNFSSELFETMLSKSIIDQGEQLDAKKQEKIIKKVAEQKWKELDTLLPNSKSVISFLENFGRFAQKITYKDTASYAPGINGFAINLDTVNERLWKEKSWKEDEIFYSLRSALETCLAYNIFELRPTNQGKKGQSWDVYYLNRWLCVKFGLPLGYGGWQKVSPKELLKWL